MIEPTTNDIGRAVVYTDNRYPGGKLEDGAKLARRILSLFTEVMGGL